MARGRGASSPHPADRQMAQVRVPAVVLRACWPIIRPLAEAERNGFLVFSRQSQRGGDKLEVAEADPNDATGSYIRSMWRELCRKQGRPCVICYLRDESMTVHMPALKSMVPIWAWMALAADDITEEERNWDRWHRAEQGQVERPVFYATTSTRNLCIPRSAIPVFWEQGFVVKAREEWAQILKPFGQEVNSHG